jgi:hypothetical protein
VEFRRTVILELVAGAIGTAIVALLVDKFRISPFWLLAFVIALLGAFYSSTLRLRIQVFRSGLTAFYMPFPAADGPPFWRRTADEFVYWGVTGATISALLRNLLADEMGSRRKYRVLLMAAKGSALREQVAFMKGLHLDKAGAVQLREIDKECAVARTRLKATLAILKNSAACREGRMEIRLFDEFLPWWIYILDGSSMVVGVLKFGQESGEQAAAVVKRSPTRSTLFDAFNGNFDRVWRTGHRV